MKIKMKGLTTFAQEAKRLGVSQDIIREYQRVRKGWVDRARAFSKRYGIAMTTEIPVDIRQIRAYKGYNIGEYLESRIETIRSRSKHASAYLTERMRTYLQNIFDAAEAASGDIYTSELFDWLETATPAQMSDVINAIGTDVFMEYHSGGQDTGDDWAESVSATAHNALDIIGIKGSDD